MEESLSLFATHLSVGIAEDESNSGKEIALAGAVAPDDNIGARREGFDDGLVLVTIIELDDIAPKSALL